MLEVFINKFIKNPNDIKNPAVREAYGKLSSIIGIICNIILCISKILVGFIFNSISIMADGFNNLSDAGSSIVTFAGFKLANKPADKDHPFGHARIEYITGLIVSFIILLLGVELVQTSFSKIISPEEQKFSIIMIFVLSFSIIMKFFLYKINMTLASKINSAAIKATAKDSLNDSISTFAVLISIIVSKLTNLKLDGYIGLLVALFIIYSGIEMIKELMNPLLGEPPSKDMVDEIINKLLSYDGVINIHDLVMHNYGADIYYATVHVEVSYKRDILESHDMIDNIEKDFWNDLGIHLVIHLDPVVTDDEETNELKEKAIKIIKSINSSLTLHDFRVVRGITHTNVLFDVVISPDMQKNQEEIRTQIKSQIKQINSKYIPVITIDYDYTNL